MKDWITERRRMHRRTYSMSNIEITKREVIASITIIAIMLLLGFGISGKITDAVEESNEKYQKAIHITDSDLFQYGMNTNVGNAFVYGDLKAVDTVTYSEIGGEYMYVEKVKERYTMHTRTYTVTVNGKAQTRTQTYWSWDEIMSEEKHSKLISFLGIEFSYGKINLPSSEYLETIKESSKIRYKYYGCDKQYTGTMFTKLKDGTISESTSFYNNRNIQEAIDQSLGGNGGNILFWIIWIVLICGVVYAFYFLENKWLE